MKRSSLILLPLILLCICASSFGQTWSGILAPSRAIDWSNAGVSGGIPTNRTQCGATIAPYSGAPTIINSALAACGANQYVQLGAGTFNLSSGVVIQAHNNVTLRGMGANKTFLVFSSANGCMGFIGDICVESGDLNWKGGPSNLSNWTAGYSKNTTVITLSSVPNLKVGYPIVLDQLDDTTDNGGVLVCSSNVAPLICSGQGDGGGAQRAGRGQVQIVTVKGCGSVTAVGASCSGSNVNVTISPGLYMPNWSSAKSPQAWWATTPIQGVGIEDLSQDDSSSSNAIGIVFFNATNSWVKGVRGIKSSQAHVEMQMSSHITVRDSYFFLTANSTSTSYGVQCYTASDSLIENNIFHGVASPEMMNGACEGLVIGYNFNILNYYTSSSGYALAATNAHSVNADLMLWEGNNLNQIYSDVFHGTHNLNTAFRNYIPGMLPACWLSGSGFDTSTYGACTNNLLAVNQQSFARFYNYIGNVLGKTGVQTNYEGYLGGPAAGKAIFSFGFGNFDPLGNVTVPDDLNSRLTTMRWGNYDTVNAANRFVASEVPSNLSGAQSPFSNPVPGSTNLPASFYYSSRPSWWPSAKPWPAIGPDVTGGNKAGVAGHANSIPAEDCYFNGMGGTSTGAGSVLNFNASDCYTTSAGGGPAPGPIDPPTGLSAVVN